MPAISSPKHVPTGVPSPSVNRKEWSVLGFYPGALTHGRDSPKGICVQFWNDFMRQFQSLLDDSQCQRKRKKEKKGKTEKNRWRDNPGCYGNCNEIEIAFANWTTRIPLQKLWYIKNKLSAATLRGLISPHDVSERKGMMFVFCSVVRAKIITSQRTELQIKELFVSSHWSSWPELSTVTLRLS